MRKIIDKTFLKFVFVGIINTFVGTAVMFGCYNLLKMDYWISSAMNYIVGSIVSYILNKKFTFNNNEKGPKPLLKFILTISICYGIAYGLAKPLVKILLSSSAISIQENIAMLVGMGLFVILNYLGQRFFAFKGELI